MFETEPDSREPLMFTVQNVGGWETLCVMVLQQPAILSDAPSWSNALRVDIREGL